MSTSDHRRQLTQPIPCRHINRRHKVSQIRRTTNIRTAASRHEQRTRLSSNDTYGIKLIIRQSPGFKQHQQCFSSNLRHQVSQNNGTLLQMWYNVQKPSGRWILLQQKQDNMPKHRLTER